MDLYFYFLFISFLMFVPLIGCLPLQRQFLPAISDDDDGIQNKQSITIFST